MAESGRTFAGTVVVESMECCAELQLSFKDRFIHITAHHQQQQPPPHGLSCPLSILANIEELMVSPNSTSSDAQSKNGIMVRKKATVPPLRFGHDFAFFFKEVDGVCAFRGEAQSIALPIHPPVVKEDAYGASSAPYALPNDLILPNLQDRRVKRLVIELLLNARFSLFVQDMQALVADLGFTVRMAPGSEVLSQGSQRNCDTNNEELQQQSGVEDGTKEVTTPDSLSVDLSHEDGHILADSS